MNRYEAKEICINFIKESKDIELIGTGFNDITEDLFVLGMSQKDKTMFLKIVPSQYDNDSLIQHISNKLQEDLGVEFDEDKFCLDCCNYNIGDGIEDLEYSKGV